MRGIVDYYGPDTGAVESALELTANLDETVLDALRVQLLVSHDSPYQSLMMPRDYAWQGFTEALHCGGLLVEFEALWVRLREHLPDAHGGCFPARDYVCATMLGSYVDADGPFTQTDFDTLAAPWRAVVERQQRSILFLAMAATWPYPAGALWPTVDAVLADAP